MDHDEAHRIPHPRRSTAEGEALARVATQAERVDRALAGGDGTVVIGTTTLIIALLVLIVALVA